VYFVNHRCEVCLDAKGPASMPEAGVLSALHAPASAAPPGHHVPPLGTSGLVGGTSIAAPEAKVLWVFDMWAETGDRPSDACNGSPLLDGDLLYVCTSNGVDREAGVAYADARKTPA